MGLSANNEVWTGVYPYVTKGCNLFSLWAWYMKVSEG